VESLMIVDSPARQFPAVAVVAPRHEADLRETVEQVAPLDSQHLGQTQDQRLPIRTRPAVAPEDQAVHNRSPVGPAELAYSHNPWPSTDLGIR
jgi:hypothetical protein